MDEQLGRGGLPAGNASWPVRSCAHGWEYDFRQGMYPTIVTEVSRRFYIKILMNIGNLVFLI